jgi:hypothetical protein
MNKICDKKMTFQECELAILRSAVDKAEAIQGKNVISSPEIKKIIEIVEEFLKKKQVICYGGTAINNILPKYSQFYNKDIEIPDYDFYSATALSDSKELADIYAKQGFEEVEAKSGQHHGTYKVFVNFIPVADITYIPKELFNAIKKDVVKIRGILYAPPNLLRMSMYLELSRPNGDVSRWEKVLKRLSLLNKHYPLKGNLCHTVKFQRKMYNQSKQYKQYKQSNQYKQSEAIYDNIHKTLIDEGVVFFGGYALSLYSQYMPRKLKNKLQKIPDFDVLSEEPLVVAKMVKEKLDNIHIKNVKIIKQSGVGEIIAPHYEIKIGPDTIGFIYEPLACHSYNILHKDGMEIKIATIDTMLSFWLAFLYANKPYYDTRRILCMSEYLFQVQQRNRLAQKGLLRRFSINCIGHQETIEEMRTEKSKKFIELKNKRNTKEYDEWFLRYRPLDKNIDNKNIDKKDIDKKNIDNKNIYKKDIDKKNIDNKNIDKKDIDKLESSVTKKNKKTKKNKIYKKKTNKHKTKGFLSIF